MNFLLNTTYCAKDINEKIQELKCKEQYNKDDNIHNIEALKLDHRLNK